MKSYVTSGTGSQQTLTGSQDEKVAVYQTLADAEADLANLEAGQIVATPDTGDEYAQPVDVIQAGNMHAVTSNAVATSNAMPVDEVTLNNVHSVTSNAVAQAIDSSTPIILDKGSVVYQENIIKKIGNSYVISLSARASSFFTDGDLAHYDSNFMSGNKVVTCSVYDNTKWLTGVLYFHGGYVSLLIPNITTVVIIACSGAVV